MSKKDGLGRWGWWCHLHERFCSTTTAAWPAGPEGLPVCRVCRSVLEMRPRPTAKPSPPRVIPGQMAIDEAPED